MRCKSASYGSVIVDIEDNPTLGHKRFRFSWVYYLTFEKVKAKKKLGQTVQQDKQEKVNSE